MQRLSAEQRHKIIDWMVFDASGEQFYGDSRDVEPTDWNISDIEWWKGYRYTAGLRRARLEAITQGEREF
jgi:hypothetical protein